MPVSWRLVIRVKSLLVLNFTSNQRALPSFAARRSGTINESPSRAIRRGALSSPEYSYAASRRQPLVISQSETSRSYWLPSASFWAMSDCLDDGSGISEGLREETWIWSKVKERLPLARGEILADGIFKRYAATGEAYGCPGSKQVVKPFTIGGIVSQEDRRSANPSIYIRQEPIRELPNHSWRGWRIKEHG